MGDVEAEREGVMVVMVDVVTVLVAVVVYSIGFNPKAPSGLKLDV